MPRSKFKVESSYMNWGIHMCFASCTFCMSAWVDSRVSSACFEICAESSPFCRARHLARPLARPLIFCKIFVFVGSQGLES